MTLPPGDATHGAELFTQSVNGAPPCSTCHQTDENTLVGPGLKGFGARAGTRVEGQSAEQYTQESIMHPASFVVSGFANAMYNQYASKLSPQDIADLTAYLLTL
ncbi:MAG: cytochrome c [Chloroflexota bacterium]